MKFFRWVLFFLIQESILIHTKKIQRLINNLNAYETVIFTDNLEKINSKQKVFLKYLMNQNPTATIDLIKVNQTNDNRSFEMQIFENPRPSAVYVLFLSDEFETSRILNKVIEISPISSRPKTLLFLPRNCSAHEEKKILIKAWSLKFLDFSIINTDMHNNYSYKTYNPFNKDYYEPEISSDKNQIFPDKLTNFHGYPLKTRAYNTPPVLSVEVKNNKIVKVGGTRLARIEYIAEKLNFTLQYMEDSHNVTKTFEKIIEDLESNVINTSPIGILLTSRFQNKDFIYGNPMNIARVIVVVPIIKTPKINGATETFVLLAIFSTILIIFYLFVRTLKLDQNYWNIFKIYGILIGISMNQPRKKVHRVIFITITVISIIFSNDYFSTLADVKVLFVEEKLDTYDDLQRFNIATYVSNFYADSNIEQGNESLFQNISSFQECIEKIIETNDAACTAPVNEAEHYSKTNLNFRGQPIMKITDLSFQDQFDAYLYEKASPFAEKIEKSLRQILESGLISVQDSKARNKFRFIDSQQSLLLEETLLMLIILVVIGTGCILAIIFFLFEFL